MGYLKGNYDVVYATLLLPSNPFSSLIKKNDQKFWLVTKISLSLHRVSSEHTFYLLIRRLN